ncbi:hypothetical protein VTG60DRAFT_227 [Thermothelomyces hinnuleus]
MLSPTADLRFYTQVISPFPHSRIDINTIITLLPQLSYVSPRQLVSLYQQPGSPHQCGALGAFVYHRWLIHRLQAQPARVSCQERIWHYITGTYRRIGGRALVRAVSHAAAPGIRSRIGRLIWLRLSLLLYLVRQAFGTRLQELTGEPEGPSSGHVLPPTPLALFGAESAASGLAC